MQDHTLVFLCWQLLIFSLKHPVQVLKGFCRTENMLLLPATAKAGRLAAHTKAGFGFVLKSCVSIS